MRVPAPVAGIAPVASAPRARIPPSVSSWMVVGMPGGAGRGLPAPLPPRTNVPELPALSVHGPFPLGNDTRASTCTARPPGAVTMWRPRPMVPSGFGVASPTSDARCGAPHWSS